MIVDVGYGSADWAVEVAETYEKTEVYGVDLSPIGPTDVPENVQLITMDVTDGLAQLGEYYAPDSFDLIHSR